jgi:hypothetical protein
VSKILKYVLAIVGTLFALIVIAWSPWSALLYRGDGKFSDDLFLYPRYCVSFAEIPLNEPGEHHFHFRGMPNAEMGLILYVKGDLANWKNRNYLTSFPASIEAKMTDGKGNVVCHAFGRPADANMGGAWVLMSGADVAGYWHYECNDFRLSTFRKYDLMIRVADVSPGADKLVVTPTLKGGGTELP